MATQRKVFCPFLENPAQHTASFLVESFRSKQKNPADYLNDLFTQIEATNGEINALTSLQRESALERAEKLFRDKPTAEQTLYGLPVIIKENIQKINFPVECASRMLKGYRGQFDSTVVQSLEQAGAIVFATANMDEFAMGSSNEHSCHGPVKNPHDTSRVSGGSSGGSAAACAAGYAPLTFGSDTGGSVREPASFCGIFGFKPTYGRISRYGLVAYGSSLDQISPFARSAFDIDLVLQAIAHEDPKDATSIQGRYTSTAKTFSPQGKRIGLVKDLHQWNIDANVRQKYMEFQEAGKNEGIEFIELELKELTYALSAYYLIACAEASSNLSRFDGIRYGHRTGKEGDLFELYCRSRSEGFGREVKRRIMLGTFALTAGYYDALYGRAQAVRKLLAQKFSEVFRQVDFLCTPTTPTSAFPLGMQRANSSEEYLCDLFTVPANLAGIPAFSVPAKSSVAELPVGLQLMANKGHDSELVALAAHLEQKNLIGLHPL